MALYNPTDPLGVSAIGRAAYRYFGGEEAIKQAREKGRKATEKKKVPQIKKPNYIDAVIGVKS